MDPFKQLAGLLDRQMADHAGKALSGIPCELGTITSSGLKLDGFKHEIQDYLVADWKAKMHFPATFFVGTSTSPVNDQGEPQPGATTTELTKYSFNEKEVDQVWIDFKPDLAPGDRVLVIPVNGGQDFIIVCKVVSAGA